MSLMPRFSIIIVTYNSANWIAGCLAGLAVQTVPDFELIVIDNASTDGTLGTLAECDTSELKLIENDQNSGFAAACNQGAARARGEWLIFLNPDTVPDPDWLEEIKAGQMRHRHAAAFACTQLDFDNPNLLDGAGDVYSVYGIAWRGGHGLPVSELPREGECFSACGAAMVIRRQIFEALNGFEESYFCYYEDVDLGFRLRLAGEACIFLPNARVRHKGGASSGQDDDALSDFSVYYGVRNRFWTYIRNMPFLLLVITMPVHLVVTGAQVFSARKTGQIRVMLSALKAAFRESPRFFASRKTRPVPTTGKSGKLGRALCKSVPKLLRGAPHIWSAKDP